jgi:hypothetical protein
MRYAWLQPTNVVKIAQQLLRMEKEVFEEAYQQEVSSELIRLEELLSQYLFPPQRGYDKRSPTEEVEQHLHRLMRCTQHVLSRLTPAKGAKLQSVLDRSFAVCDTRGD